MTATPVVISLAALAGRSGRGVRVAVVDTGIHRTHPHIGGVEAGIAIDEEGSHDDNTADRLGHGTAVAAAIHEKAPDASLLPVKVFDRSLSTTGVSLAQAVRWSVSAGAHLINLSLGTTNADHREPLTAVVDEANAAGVIIVAAAPDDSHAWIPGGLPGVVAVELDWSISRDECAIVSAGWNVLRLRASGYPRPIPGVSPDRNLKGQSFAVANATGLLALVLQDTNVRSLSTLIERFFRGPLAP
jgi:subtilisin family serine protease